MTKIKYPVSQPSITELEHDLVTRAVKSGWISSLGEFIDQFERGFSKFCGTKHAIATSNGTTALHLALTAMDIGPGDEVIIPDLSFIATANVVLQSGAIPVFADIDAEHLCLDARELVRHLTPRTKAIMPVHLYGHPAEMPAINDFAKEHGLAVIEDAAEAHGARVGETKVGNLGDCGAFSFYANKILTTGEGGMITTNSDELNERCRVLRDHAMSKEKRYWHTEPGFNYRITNLQAALGCAQLDRAEVLIEKRHQIYRWYESNLRDSDIRLNRNCAWATPAYWMICAEFPGMDERGRNEFMSRLRERGVDSRPYFYPMSDMPYFRTANTPVTHRVSPTGINLPTYFDLAEEDVATICEAVVLSWRGLC